MSELPSSPQGLITRWLAKAPMWVFTLYAGAMAFGAYFAMYAYRKPFSAASYGTVPGWDFVLDFKIALVIAQVFGYALSKIIGVKVISELPAHRRALAILVLIGVAELALLGFALTPAPWNVGFLFLNGLPLGLIWGLVFGFIEGRRVSEVVGAILCASFIVSSGVVKSVGKWVMLQGWASEVWMPVLTGLLFVPLLLLTVWGLAQLPPPSAADEAARVKRAPMDGKARAALFFRFAPGLLALIGVYVLLTAFRDFRDNFAAEIWTELGYGDAAEIFTWSEIPVAIVVLGALAFLARFKDNGRALLANMAFVAVGAAILGGATLAWQAGLINPVVWMILLGAGLYLAYTPFNGLLFDRLIAATGTVGTAGFLIYVADASGYVGAVALMLVKNFVDLNLDWVAFLSWAAYGTSAVGLVFTLLAGGYFAARIKRN
ncbi:MAG: DUF5690 family protein [Asticcacaulis sp.]